MNFTALSFTMMVIDVWEELWVPLSCLACVVQAAIASFWQGSAAVVAGAVLFFGQAGMPSGFAQAVFPVWEQFMEGLRKTSWLEYTAVVAGITSVWFSKKENILVFPVGLISTVIYVYLSFKYDLIGEASVNIYYSVLSVYGWMLWARKNKRLQPVLHISFSGRRQWLQQLSFFVALYAIIYFCLVYLQSEFYPGVIPWADAFASATAYTGMWLMARKKVESWYWWIGTNISSIPLYFVKGLVFTSVFFFILLLMSFAGLAEWKRRARKATLLA